MPQLSIEALERKAAEIREDIIRMLEAAGSGHPGGSLGQADIYTALYFHILNHDPANPDWEERDILVQSNGHTCPVRYACMAHAGYFDRKELLTLRKLGSRLQGHPEREKLPGLETTSGPLGSGIGQAVGMAIALRLNKQLHRRVYVTTGDGELSEGNMWESILMAAKYQLTNLVAIVDRNGIQIDGPTEVVMPLEDLRMKWEGFGWDVIDIDGHNMQAIIDACNKAKAAVGKPTVIIAHTIPGKGVKYMEYDYRFHGGGLSHDQAIEAIRELHTLRGKINQEVK